MAMMKWPWLLNQPMPEDMGYPAELVRAQHYAATSGGNGVSSPTAMKVMAQPAPDGTVRIQPGGADVVSTYAGQSGQSYNLYQDVPETFEVSPTGSQERHDIVIARVCDPDHDTHPDVSGEITPEQAADMQFWWYEVIEGRSPSTFNPDYPYVPLARIMRGPNKTIVEQDDIRDIRELSNPKSQRFVEARNLNQSEEQAMHTGTTVFPEAATSTVHIPEFASVIKSIVTWGTLLAPAGPSRISGYCNVAIIHPDGSEIAGQISRFSVPYNTAHETRFTVTSGNRIRVPAKFRGQDCRVEMRATKETGQNAYADGTSSYAIDFHFEQEVA